jgi:hypothetical protein
VLTTIGPWLLVAGAALILVEGAVAAAWGFRLARQGKALATRLERDQSQVEADVQRLRETLEETRRLWAPYRRALLWLRHPLVAALMGSLWRRWRAA